MSYYDKRYEEFKNSIGRIIPCNEEVSPDSGFEKHSS